MLMYVRVHAGLRVICKYVKFVFTVFFVNIPPALRLPFIFVKMTEGGSKSLCPFTCRARMGRSLILRISRYLNARRPYILPIVYERSVTS